jgi:hypothetical protein
VTFDEFNIPSGPVLGVHFITMTTDWPHLRRPIPTIWVAGVILVGLGSMVFMITQLRPLWRHYRDEAAAETVQAEREAKRAANADHRAAGYKQFGNIAEAESWAKSAKLYRQREAMHRQEAKKYLQRWW